MSAMFGADLEQKHCEEAVSLREDETIWATKSWTMSKVKNL